MTIPGGTTLYRLSFTEVDYVDSVHGSDEFKNVVISAIATELEVLLKEVHIYAIKSGTPGFVVDFFTDEDRDPVEKHTDIVARIRAELATTDHSSQYLGLSVASISTAATPGQDQDSPKKDSKMGLSIGIGFGIAIGVTIGIVSGISSYRRK
jgi:hypothetical protein